jgi:hypothetical protein
VADVDCLILGSVNASLRRTIDAPTLIDALNGGAALNSWPEHVRAFFEDVPREAMMRFMLLHRLDGPRLSRICCTVIEESPHRADLADWISEFSPAT